MRIGALIALFAAALALACGESSVPTKLDAGGDAPFDTAPPRVSICPTELPRAKDPCSQPEGTTCLLGACGDNLATCRGGQWTLTAALPEPAQCPEFLPKPGTTCPRCFPAQLRCIYSCEADAGADPRQANCRENAVTQPTWVLVDALCPAGDAGATEAGATEAGRSNAAQLDAKRTD